MHTSYKNSCSRKRSRIAVLLCFLLAAGISSCDRDKNNPGYIFYPDMTYSTAYETYTRNLVFEDGYTQREPAEGTIPRGVVPYAFEKTEEDRVLAAKSLVNPLQPDEQALERGKKMYEVYCSICHGPSGNGQGPLYTSGKYTFPPASLLSETMMTAPEGDIYHVITVGHGIMAAHGTMISPEDRWKIAMYVKHILQK